MIEIPRRNRLNQFSAAEQAIWDATQVVESAGAHPLLTEAVNLLTAARAKVADFVELCPTCGGKQRVEARNPQRAMAWEVPCPDCALPRPDLPFHDETMAALSSLTIRPSRQAEPDDCDCVGAVIGQHDRSCALSSQLRQSQGE